MNVFKKVKYFVRKGVMKRPATAILLVLLILYIGAIMVVRVTEGVGFMEANWLMIPAFLGEGELGIFRAESFLTKLSILVALFVSIAMLAIITAKITTVFIEFCKRGGSFMQKVDFENHIIICGWNFQGENIIKEIRSAKDQKHSKIVILANLPIRPTKDESVEYIKGDPTQDEDLKRAGILNADSVIIMSDMDKNANEADAESLMITLAVETLNRQVHTCVQLLNSANRRHLERAHADEIICLDQMGGNILVASALYHGVSHIISELLTFSIGSDIYRYDGQLSDRIAGKEFDEALCTLARDKIIMVAFETDYSDQLYDELIKKNFVHKTEEGNRIMVVNPKSPYKIRQGDALFIIAKSRPEML